MWRFHATWNAEKNSVPAKFAMPLYSKINPVPTSVNFLHYSRPWILKSWPNSSRPGAKHCCIIKISSSSTWTCRRHRHSSPRPSTTLWERRKNLDKNRKWLLLGVVVRPVRWQRGKTVKSKCKSSENDLTNLQRECNCSRIRNPSAGKRLLLSTAHSRVESAQQGPEFEFRWNEKNFQLCSTAGLVLCYCEAGKKGTAAEGDEFRTGKDRVECTWFIYDNLPKSQRWNKKTREWEIWDSGEVLALGLGLGTIG